MKNLIRFAPVLVLVFGSALPAAAAAAAPVAPAGYAVNTVVGGLTLPTSFAFAPDGRIFVGEKHGVVREIKSGVLQATPVVTLPDVNDFADRGLESITLDPDFAHNGYLYIAYTHENDPTNYQGPKTGRLVRVTVVGDTADLGSEVVLLGTVGGDATNPSCVDFATTSDCIPSDSKTHSMGDLHFGPDGKLYATLGEGAGYLTVDPLALRAQDLDSLGGKTVRLNPDGSAPADNPFYDGNASDNRSKVWSLGERNAYRFTFRPSDGVMFFGDVGWATWEEIDVGHAGANYGWPCLEGFASTTYNCTPSSTPTPPIYVYDHSSGSGSVIGGSFPSAYFPGDYFFGDYSNDYIKRMTLNPDNSVAGVSSFITSAGGPVDIQTGPNGDLFYLALNKGELREVVATSTSSGGTGGTTGGTSTDPAPHLTAISAVPGTGQVGSAQTITATVHNNGGTNPFVVDIEVVNANAPLTLVAQKFYDPASQATGADGTYTLTWTPPAAGTYEVKVGLFKEGWGSLWEWDEPALTLTVGGQTAVSDPAPRFLSASSSPAQAVVGTQETLSANIANSGGTGNFITDLEVYDASGHQVAQQITDPSSIAQGASKTFSLAWTPSAADTYTFKVGLFSEGWSKLLEWTDQALTVTVGGAANNTPAAPHFVNASSSPAQAVVGAQETLSATLSNSGGAGNFIADLEIYDALGHQVAQQVYDPTSIAQGGTKAVTITWTPASAGTYTLKVGLFSEGWATLLEWTDQALVVPVGTITNSGPPNFSATVSVAQASTTTGSTDPVTITVHNSGGPGDALIDVEFIKDPYIFAQDVINNQHFAAGETKVYTYNFQVPFEGQYGVPSRGNYHIDLGVMHTDWSSPWVWYNAAAWVTAEDPPVQ